MFRSLKQNTENVNISTPKKTPRTKLYLSPIIPYSMAPQNKPNLTLKKRETARKIIQRPPIELIWLPASARLIIKHSIVLLQGLHFKYGGDPPRGEIIRDLLFPWSFHPPDILGLK